MLDGNVPMDETIDLTHILLIHVYNDDSHLILKHYVKQSHANLPERITDRHQYRHLWFP
jgi:hypothetical protein